MGVILLTFSRGDFVKMGPVRSNYLSSKQDNQLVQN